MGQHTLTAMTSQASLALMKFLSDLSRQLGVGKHTYVVGGAVRNFVIDQPIKDIDVVIDSVALKGKDSEWFAQQVAKAIPVQTKITTNQYGVALLHVVGDWMLGGTNLKGEDIEIANARRESYTDGGYTPTEVAPATIYEDTVRREFTFNTLLWRLHDLADGPDKAEILDLTGCGLRDLQEGVMRCPTSPDKTFSDDPSRMIRAVKFLIKYGFTISLEVKRSIEKNKAKLKNIPHAHLSNMLINTFLREPTGKKALLEMQKLGLLDVIKEIAQTQKPFREALANWADKEAKVEFLFDLMDLGLPAGKRLSFLSLPQQEQVRDITIRMSHAEADQFLQVLAQPGRVLDTQALMLEYNLKGSDVRQITDVARGVLLSAPELVKNPTNFMARVRMGLAPGVRIVAKTFELNPGDPILYGKFLNKPGTISGFGVNDKGDPTIVVESIHGGPPKELKLFKVRYDEGRAPVVAALESVLYAKTAVDRLAARYETALLAEIGQSTADGDGVPLRAPSILLRTRPDYGEYSMAAIPRGYEGEMEHHLALVDMFSQRQAAKYKNKKTVKTKDGDEAVVYEYSEKQVQNRNREKAERVEKLRGNLHKLQSQVKKDLKSDDPKTRLCALAVGLMNDTYERVGNDESAKDGHVGVTGWTPEHVKFSDGKATFTYVGKSGVDHKKETKDADLIRVLKEAVKDKKKGETLFTYEDGRVDASAVNEYLDGLDLGITAKDIRGLHANREMQERLKAVRSKGGKLPEDKKEREKKLKDEFKEALEGAAEAVGHEPATLKSQYLVPGLEDTYLKDGTVLDKLHEKKSSLEEMAIRRLVARHLARRQWERPQPGYWVQVLDMGGKEKARHWVEDFQTAQTSAAGASQAPGVQRVVLRDRTNMPLKAFVRGKPVGSQMEQSVRKLAALYLATKSDAQKEDKDIRQMLKPDPKKKPPREDLRRDRMRTEDPDMAGEGDKDLSLNYKKVARLVGRWLRAGDEPKEPEHKPGDVWKSEDGRWTAKNPKGNSHTFDEKPQAEAFAKGKDPDEAEKPKKDPTKALGALADALTSANGKAIESAKKELLAAHPELEAQVKEHLDAYEAANKELAKAAIKAEGLSGKDKKDALKSLDALEAKRNEATEAVRNLKPEEPEPEEPEPEEPEPEETEPEETEPEETEPEETESEEPEPEEPEDKAPETPKPAPKPKKDPADPLGGKSLSKSPLEEEDLVTRGEETFNQFRAADKTKARKEAATAAVTKLAELDPESPQAQELNRVIDGIHLAMEMNGEKWDILGPDGKLLREPLDEKMGVLADQMVGQGQVRVLLSNGQDHHAVRESVRDALGRLDDSGLQLMSKETPWEPLGELLGGLGGMTLDPEVAELLRGLIRDLSINNMTTNQGLINAVAGKKMPASNPLEAFDEVKKKFSSKNLEGAIADVAKCVKDGGKAEDCKDLVDQARQMQVKGMGENLDKAIKEAGVEPDPQNPHVAAIRHAVETGDASILDEKLQPARTFQEEKADYIKNLKDPEERKQVQEMDEAEFRAMLEGKFGD